jgi:hypothetical protein
LRLLAAQNYQPIAEDAPSGEYCLVGAIAATLCNSCDFCAWTSSNIFLAGCRKIAHHNATRFGAAGVRRNDGYNRNDTIASG